MPYRYLGYETRTYVQYMDADADRTLIASPGVTYDIRPAGSMSFPLPPADGLWELSAPVSDPPDVSAPAAVPAPLMTAASTEDERE